MATVNITKNLKDHVRGRIRERFAPKINALNEEFAIHATTVYRCFVSAEEEAMCRALGDSFVKENGAINFKTPGGRHLVMNLPAPRPACDRISGTYGWGERAQIQPEHPCYEAISDIERRLIKTEFDRDKLEKDMSALMDQCANLRQLEKVWPSMTEFISEDALKRHRSNEKSKSTRFDPSAVHFDDSTKSLLVKTLMTTA